MTRVFNGEKWDAARKGIEQFDADRVGVQLKRVAEQEGGNLIGCRMGNPDTPGIVAAEGGDGLASAAVAQDGGLNGWE